MINRMALASLGHRPIRTALGVLAIGLEVAMILLIVGLSEGLLLQSEQRTRGTGADILIRPSTSSAAMSLSTADLSQKLIQVLKERIPEIGIATGATLFMHGNLVTSTGVVWEEFDRMAGGIRFLEGGPMEGPYDAVVDEYYARYRDLHAGDAVQLFNRDFRVAGVIESGKMSRLFVPRSTMQELMGWEGKVSQIYIKLKDPAQTEAVIEKIEEMLPGYPVWSMEQLVSQAAADVRAMSSQFTNVIIGIAVVIGFIVVLLSMYTAILERTREIGILKSLGASKAYIINIVVRETLITCCGGVVLGIAMTFAAKTLIETKFPLLSVLILPEWLLWGAGLAAGGALLGALYPAARAARQDPIEALAYD